MVHRKIQSSAWAPSVCDIEMQLVDGSHAPPILLEGTPEVECADVGFASALGNSERLTRLLTSLEAMGSRYCVFGGWLRDTLSAQIYGTPGPRDVDLVAANISVDTLVAALPTDISRTMFGGVQSSVRPVPFDIWPLHETFLIRALSMPVSFGSLLQTADFNINAALYFPAQGGKTSTILDAGMVSAIQRKCLSFNASHLPFPIIQCSRIIAYSAKLNLKFDPGVLAFVHGILEDSSKRRQVIDGLQSHQPQDVADKAISKIWSIIEGKP